MEISRLKSIRKDLIRQKVAEFHAQAEADVGRCFKIDGEYVKIISVPQETMDVSGNIHFNRYQYPALFLGYVEGDSPIPFYCDTLFSGYWRDDAAVSDHKRYAVEVSTQEFSHEFDRLLQEFRKKVGV